MWFALVALVLVMVARYFNCERDMYIGSGKSGYDYR